MQFAEIDNPFGTAIFLAPTAVKVKPYKLRKTTKGTKVRRGPTAPSIIIKNFLLNYNS